MLQVVSRDSLVLGVAAGTGNLTGGVVAKTEFIHTPTIEINLNSQIHLVSTSELIENDSLNRKITQAINNQ